MRKKTHQEFVTEMENKMPNISVLGTYTGNKSKIEVKCKKCGHNWFPCPNSLLSGHGCPKCSSRYKRTNEEFVNELTIVNPHIKVLSEFTTTYSKINVRCNICNHKWSITPNHLLRGIGCPNCKSVKISSSLKMTHDEFITRLGRVNKKINVLSKYEAAQSKVDCHCTSCNHTWSATPANLLSGHGCPICNESKGEKAIYSYLVLNEISFEIQKKYDGLIGVNNGQLSYDFFLPNQDLLIEFQGVQHERPVDFDGYGYKNAKYNFDIQKEHDRRKRNYAKRNSINLLEIWYFDIDRIEEILNMNIDFGKEKRVIDEAN